MSEKFSPSFDAAKLYERVSARGNVYLSGRLGGLKLVALKTSEVDQDGHPVWQLKVSAAAPRKDQPSLSSEPSSISDRHTSSGIAGAVGDAIDDVIPF